MFYVGYKLDADIILKSYFCLYSLLKTHINIHTVAQYIQQEGGIKQTIIN